MGEYDQYGLPELCDIVEADNPEEMRRQADGWGVLAEVYEDQLGCLTMAQTRLSRAWNSATSPAGDVFGGLETALSEAARTARANQDAWHGIAHYTEYAQEQLADLHRHWLEAKKTLDAPPDRTYVPESVEVQVMDGVDEERMRVSYDETARRVMDLVAAYTVELTGQLREMPTYTPPTSEDGGLSLPTPEAATATDPHSGGTAPDGNEDPHLQHGPGAVPFSGGMGPGAGPMLAGHGGGGAVPPTAPGGLSPGASGGGTAPMLASPATPAPGRQRVPRITRAPKGAEVRREPGAIGKRSGRRPVAVPVEYDVARLRRRAATEHAEDDEWKNPPESGPGIISGARR
ncbi:MAG TPA: hypothetical protein H9881_05400 [Candidatus Stackebrandtia excrementipullorum]|nr:hypothetical protein [Candidatus Stackebrandtia excrementipullorum]